MLVEGGKLKELAEEESIKSRREQRKVSFGEERAGDTEEEDTWRGAGDQVQAASLKSVQESAQGREGDGRRRLLESGDLQKQV